MSYSRPMTAIPVIPVLVLLCLLGMAPRAAGQQSPDVPYVPTPWAVVEAMLKIAGVSRDDFLIDLGSGDGRIVIAAAKRHGTRGLGVDLDANLVNTARREAAGQGVSDKVEFHARNLFITDIGRATVLTMYLLPQINMQLRPRLFAELRPGTRIVSHDFDMGSWQPDRRLTVAVPDKPYGPPTSEIYLWVVPADASGKWQWRLPAGNAMHDYEVTFEQTFQALAGVPRVAGRGARLDNARMRGQEISFVLTAQVGAVETRHEFSGRVAGDVITGIVKAGGDDVRMEWNAKRLARGKMDIHAAARLPAVAH
jgi:hypothetical protein